MARSRRRWLLLLPLVPVLILGAMSPGNVAQTRPDHPDARLRTRRYHVSLLQARQAVEEVVPALRTYGRAWKFQDPSLAPDGAKLGVLNLRIEVPVIVFTDDLKVTIVEDGADDVTLNVLSQSRVGKGDFGENRRHILQLLAVLDTKLKK